MTDTEKNELRGDIASAVLDKIIPHIKQEMSAADVFELIDSAIGGTFVFVASLFNTLERYRTNNTYLNVEDPLTNIINHYMADIVAMINERLNHDNKTN